MLPVALWILRPAYRVASRQQRAWHKLNRRLARLDLQAQLGEGPRAWQQRLSDVLPHQRGVIAAFFDDYVELTYATAPGDSHGQDFRRLERSLTELLRALPRRRPPRPTRLAGLPDEEPER